MTAMTRRRFLATPAAACLQARERVSSEVFLRSPAKGVAVMADAYYTRRSGGAMVSIEHRFSRSDTVDAAYYRYSKDYGRTWGPPVEKTTGEKRPEGMLRRHPRTAIVDPKTGRFIEFWIEGILPTDDPLEGMRQWNIYYRVDAAFRQAEFSQSWVPVFQFITFHHAEERPRIFGIDIVSLPPNFRKSTSAVKFTRSDASVEIASATKRAKYFANLFDVEVQFEAV